LFLSQGVIAVLSASQYNLAAEVSRKQKYSRQVMQLTKIRQENSTTQLHTVLTAVATVHIGKNIVQIVYHFVFSAVSTAGNMKDETSVTDRKLYSIHLAGQ
jgi:hypothetical protein